MASEEQAAQVRETLHNRVKNNFGFHTANDASRPLHEESRRRFKDLADWVIDNVPVGREQSTCLTALQDAAMWSNAGIACNLAPLEG